MSDVEVREQLRELIDGLEPATAALLHRIALQDLADAAWNEQIGPFLSGPDVASLISPNERPLTRQAVAQRRDLLGVPTGRGTVYPVVQFDGRRPLPGLRAVLDALRPVAGPLLVASWLTSPHPDLDDRTPAAALCDRDEDAVWAAARALAAGLAA